MQEMKVPFCDNPKCPLYEVKVDPKTTRISDIGVRKSRKEYFDEKTRKGYHYCEDCIETAPFHTNRESETSLSF